MATYGTFVDGTTLKASELNDFLTTVSNTPVISQPGAMLGTRSGRYFKVNKFVFYQFYIAFSTSGTANNAIQLDLPVTAATNSVRVIGNGYYQTATDVIPLSIIRTSTTKASFLTDLSTSLSTFLGQTGGPTLTIAAGSDVMSGCVYYEAA